MTSSPALRPVGFGIIGVGMIAEFHAQAIAETTGAVLAGVSSRNLANATAFAQRHQIPYVASSVAELVARPEIDVVCVTTSAGAHLEPALQAIRAGKHVIVEKPLEITPARVDQLLDAADQAGVKIGAIFQGRFGDGARTVKAALDAGRFGKLILASAAVKWHRTAQYYTGTRGSLDMDGGGALMAQAIHAIDLLQWFAGMPREVFCATTRRVHAGIEAEDTASAVLKFPEGALGTIEATTAAWPGWRRRIEICGELGSVALEDDHIARWDFQAGQPGDDTIRQAHDGAALGSGASRPNAISTVGHQRQIADFASAVRSGHNLAVDGREGRKAVALVHALYESSRLGKPVIL